MSTKDLDSQSIQNESAQPAKITRRDALKRIAMASGVGVCANLLASCAGFEDSGARGGGYYSARQYSSSSYYYQSYRYSSFSYQSYYTYRPGGYYGSYR